MVVSVSAPKVILASKVQRITNLWPQTQSRYNGLHLLQPTRPSVIKSGPIRLRSPTQLHFYLFLMQQLSSLLAEIYPILRCNQELAVSFTTERGIPNIKQAFFWQLFRFKLIETSVAAKNNIANQSKKLFIFISYHVCSIIRLSYTMVYLQSQTSFRSLSALSPLTPKLLSFL